MRISGEYISLIPYDDAYIRRFLWDQESQLWDIFQDLDKNGDGRLDATEMRAALSRSGIDITPATVTDLVRFLASGSKATTAGKQTAEIHGGGEGLEKRADAATAGSSGPGVDDMYITFQEFRDFLIMLPRKATPFEIYKCESTFPNLIRLTAPPLSLALALIRQSIK